MWDFLQTKHVCYFLSFKCSYLDTWICVAIYERVLFLNDVDLFCFEIPISAEMVVQETIDYNDLVNLVEDEKDLTVDKYESKYGLQLKEDHEDPNDPRVRLKRYFVGIMSAFRLKDLSSHHVIIANTHLYWDPEWADVKIAQAKYLLSRLAGFKELVIDKFDCTPSTIVTGDFNSVPGDQVKLHQSLFKTVTAGLCTSYVC
ncbi:hypothetical protein ACJIZ3_014349 [Penstemon smallii]|uniref:Endonuclease/exonuclease/phosphatase domain-containing protein n=1 Tax=Penstemon smallii TaxID=265156 RepID=A0ABD3RMK7_9LAMI